MSTLSRNGSLHCAILGNVVCSGLNSIHSSYSIDVGELIIIKAKVIKYKIKI